MHRVFCVLLYLIGCSLALSIEQAGKYDWLRQHIGHVSQVHIDESTVVLGSSTTGVLGVVSSVDGKILWRHVLDSEEDGVDEEVIEGVGQYQEIVLMITNKNRLAAFRAADGQQLWETPISNQLQCKSDKKSDVKQFKCEMQIIRSNATRQSSVLVTGRGTLASYSLSTGRNLWSTSVGKTEEYAASAVAIQSEPGVPEYITFVTLQKGGQELKVVNINSTTGEIEGELSSKIPTANIESLFALPNVGIIISEDNTSLCTLDLLASSAKASCTNIQHILPSIGRASSTVNAPKIIRGECKSVFSLQAGNDGAALVRYSEDDSQRLQQINWFPESLISGCRSGKVALIDRSSSEIASADENPVSMKVYDINENKILFKISEPVLYRKDLYGDQIDVSAIYVGADGDVLAHLYDDTIFFSINPTSLSKHNLSVNGIRTWARQESLASVTSALFADLPAPTHENEAEWISSQPSLKERVQIEFLALKSQAGFANPSEKAAVERFRNSISDRLRPTRDPDGFRRQIIVLTNVGKVASLHSGDGRILWEVDFGRTGGASKLVIWRKPYDVNEDELIAVLRNPGSELVASIINTRTGALEAEERLSIPENSFVDILPSSKLLQDDSAEQSVYFVLLDGKISGTWPSVGSAQQFALSEIPNIVQWKFKKEESAIVGYNFDSDNKLKEIWRFSAGKYSLDHISQQMSILTIAAKDPCEIVYSAARPTASGGILLKHINPNTILVIMGVKEKHSFSKTGNRGLIAVLLDSATGSVLTSQTHLDGTGPVHAIVSEHWAGYHFWSTKHERWQISVIDAYRPVPPELSSWDFAMGRVSSPAMQQLNISDLRDLSFERQSYLTRIAADSLSVTKTAHGTAAKMLLVATPGGQIAQIDRRLLDPRRPVIPAGAKLSKAQAAEGLPPYHSELIIPGPSFATLNRRILKLRSIYTAPAILESASLMLGVGIDLFYARLQPSRGFDMVPDDFPHALLVTMVMGMAVALMVLKTLLQKRALKLKWQ